MKRIFCSITFMTFCIGINAFAANTPDTLSSLDKQFVEKVAYSGHAEVEMGKLAEQRAYNEEIKDYARTLVADHADANEKLRDAVADQKISLPSEPNQKQKDHYAKLEEMEGNVFDKHFVDHMVADHKEAIAAFQNEAKNGKDPELKEFAKSTLPKLEGHLKTAEQLAKNMK